LLLFAAMAAGLIVQVRLSSSQVVMLGPSSANGTPTCIEGRLLWAGPVGAVLVERSSHKLAFFPSRVIAAMSAESSALLPSCLRMRSVGDADSWRAFPDTAQDSSSTRQDPRVSAASEMDSSPPAPATGGGQSALLLAGGFAKRSSCSAQEGAVLSPPVADSLVRIVVALRACAIGSRPPQSR
jgi:hypothetical protein